MLLKKIILIYYQADGNILTHKIM